MTLHLHWFHAPRWLARHQLDRALALVLGIIGVSLVFGVLRVVDAAVSGALVERRAAPVAPLVPRPFRRPDFMTGGMPPSAGASIETNAVEVPDATAEALRL